MLTDQELQSLRNLGNEAEAAADEIKRLRAELVRRRTRAALPQAVLPQAVRNERERLLALAKRRAAHEASAAAHHAGKWQPAHEHHLTRHAAMRDLIDALEGQSY